MLPAAMTAEKPPSSPKSTYASSRPAEETAFSLRGKRAVVAEDEGVTQLQLRKILRLEGIVVVGTAANGREAVEVVLNQKPDFVLMDVRMPMMDGLEAARRILAEYRVCIIMLTAFSEEEYMRQAQEIGACGYVVKPITSETLLPQVTAALQKFSRQE